MQPRVTFVTLGVAEIAASRRFYEALGFRASSASNDSVAFFDAGGIVLALFGRADLAKDATVPDDGAGFTRVALAHNVKAPEDVARVLAEAEAAGARILKPSQRAFWGGTSAYFADPDGHVWEVAHNPFFPLDAEGRVQIPPPNQT